MVTEWGGGSDSTQPATNQFWISHLAVRTEGRLINKCHIFPSGTLIPLGQEKYLANFTVINPILPSTSKLLQWSFDLIIPV